MNNKPPRLQDSTPTIAVANLEKYADGWIISCQISQHSERTLGNRRMVVEKLLWYFKQKKIQDCGVDELRLFLAYLSTGHKDPGGRWGNPQLTETVKSRQATAIKGRPIVPTVRMGAIERIPVHPIFPTGSSDL